MTPSLTIPVQWGGMFGALASVCAGSAAAARNSQEADGFVVMRSFADCVARANPQGAEAYLATEPHSAEDYAEASKLARRYEHCLTNAGSLRFQPLLLRGAMAESQYRRKFGRIGPGIPTAWSYADTWREQGSSMNEKGRASNAALYNFAACVVRKDPIASHDFLMSNFDSSKEKVALAVLTPFLSPCLSASMKATFNRTTLRAVFAEALLHSVRGGANA